jgi:hypothetical protein
MKQKHKPKRGPVTSRDILDVLELIEEALGNVKSAINRIDPRAKIPLRDGALLRKRGWIWTKKC